MNGPRRRAELAPRQPCGLPSPARRSARRLARWGPLALVAVLVVAGCRSDEPSGSPITSSTLPPPTTSAPGASGNYVDRFFAGLAAQSEAGGTAMVAAASPGSPAELYARHLMAMRSVLGDGTPAQVTRSSSQIRLCHTPAGPEQNVDCVVYDDVDTDDEGRISEFSIAGTAITDRIAGRGTVVTSERITVEQVSAYRSPASATLIVTIEIDNGGQGEVEVFPFAATYRPFNGGPALEADGAWGSSRVAAGSAQQVAMQFADEDFGGLLLLTGWTEGGIGVSFPLRISTQP